VGDAIVYDLLKEHFGERPSARLARSLAGKETPRLEDLLSKYSDLARTKRQVKPPNTLRPCVYMPSADNGMIIGPKPPGLLSASHFRHLLLYCQSVAFEDRLGHALWREYTGSKGPFLVSVSSVIGYYSMHFGDLLSSGIAVPLVFDPVARFSPSPESRQRNRPDSDLIWKLSERTFRDLIDFDPFENRTGNIASDLVDALTATSDYGACSDLWLPEREHLRLLTKYIKKTQQITTAGPELRKMIDVAQLRVPNIEAISDTAIVGIRQSEPIFARWRAALSSAIEYRAEVSAQGVGDPEAAFMSRLRESEAELLESSHRVQMKTIFSGGVRNFSIGATAAGVTAAIFGEAGLGASLTTGAVTAGLSALSDTVGLAEDRAGRKALRQHFYVVLRDDTSTGRRAARLPWRRRD
jgi:hypothetical protein